MNEDDYIFRYILFNLNLDKNNSNIYSTLESFERIFEVINTGVSLSQQTISDNTTLPFLQKSILNLSLERSLIPIELKNITDIQTFNDLKSKLDTQSILCIAKIYKYVFSRSNSAQLRLMIDMVDDRKPLDELTNYCFSRILNRDINMAPIQIINNFVDTYKTFTAFKETYLNGTGKHFDLFRTI